MVEIEWPEMVPRKRLETTLALLKEIADKTQVDRYGFPGAHRLLNADDLAQRMSRVIAEEDRKDADMK